MKRFFTLSTIVLMVFTLNAQVKNTTINLPKHETSNKTTLMQALTDRHSERAFSGKEINMQELSNLLWSACGVNRPDGKRTAATAKNQQEVNLYVCMAKGAYLYNAAKNTLELISSSDLRNDVAGFQDFVKDAPISLIIVADYSKLGNDERAKLMAAIDAGIVSQNISLYCTAAGLVTVPRATMNIDKLKVALKLSDASMPMLNHPVGYKK